MGTKKPKRRSEVAPKKRALDYLASGRTQDALAWAEAENRSQDLENCMAAARIFKATEEFEQLTNLYQHLQTLQPDNRIWRVAEVCVAAELGDEQKVKQQLDDADLEPLTIDELKLLAGACVDGQQFLLAADLYGQAQQLDKDDAEVVLQLAVAIGRAGEQERAVAVLEDLLSGEIKNPAVAAQAWFNLGVVKEYSDDDVAIQAYQSSLKLAPSYEAPVANLAILLTRQGKFAEAIEFLQPKVAEKIDWPRTAVLMASANRLNNQLDTAIEILKSVVDDSAKTTKDNLAWEMLIRCLIERGDYETALSRCQAWLKVDPESAIAAHMMAAIEGNNTPERASAEYVAKTFDSFADSFDTVLQNLEYRAPQLVGHLVGETLGPPAADRVILDAGCGTGLAGPFLKPFAKSLTGVDLSKKMIQQAIDRKCYDSLEVVDLLDYLKATANQQKFDLITAADTFNYFGNLSELLPACFASLKTNGWLVFTLEFGETYGETYQLEVHGRYTHPPGYLMEQLGECGIEGGEMHRAVLRKENGVDVNGLLVAAQKP